ncbi:MAG: hypothetical protein ACRD3K_02945 [Edaphobacter sp.]
MMRRLGGSLLVVVGVVLLVVQGVHASERGGDSFDALVKGLSAHYSVQPKTIPPMWMVSLCARGATHGGVRGMCVVEFENFEGRMIPEGLIRRCVRVWVGIGRRWCGSGSVTAANLWSMCERRTAGSI